MTLSTATPWGKSSCTLAAHALGGLLTSSVPTLKDLKGQRWEEGCFNANLPMLPYDGALLWHTNHVQAQELRA